MIDLAGLATAPAQVWGGVRLVPLVRQEPITSLRLHPRLYGTEYGADYSTEYSAVAVGPRDVYCSYIPHGFVADWTDDDSPAAAYGTQLTAAGGGEPRRHERRAQPSCVPLRFHRRMARRVAKNRLRFMPLHLALEGYLALHFGGPEIVWAEWSRRAVDQGLSPRAEQAYVGAEVKGLEDALRVFEILPGQCGVLIYAADALAAAFVVPHPNDYRVLHPTLVHDLYGELIYHYAMLTLPVQDFRPRIEADLVRTLADLRAQVRRRHAEWEDFHEGVMAAGLLESDHTFDRVYRMGPYTLSRFLPAFRRQRENHIGEVITGPDGRLAYLKTFRLSENQVRRGHLLTVLAANEWHLEATAAALSLTPDQLALRIEGSGFGALLRQDVLDHYRAQARRATR